MCAFNLSEWSYILNLLAVSQFSSRYFVQKKNILIYFRES